MDSIHGYFLYRGCQEKIGKKMDQMIRAVMSIYKGKHAHGLIGVADVIKIDFHAAWTYVLCKLMES